jgi:non-specific serine/threonine protein kinase
VSSSKRRLPGDRRTNLPPDVTPFVGRERELDELLQVCHDTRLLSLLGPAGVGKSRLARQLAAQLLRQFTDGVWLVRLGPVEDGELLPGLIARALDIPQSGPGETLAVLDAALSWRRMLLLLDGCEHMVDQVALVVDNLLYGCPNLTVVATSQERIGLVPEHVWHVPPLEVPQPGQTYTADELAGVEAVRLFVQRARHVRPGFAIVESNAAAVGELVRLLDGLPLAVELAAGWMAAISPAELVRELDDRYQILIGQRGMNAPHDGLWAAIESGYQRLDPPAQSLLSQLGVFAGGWNLGTMTEVCRLQSVRAVEVLRRLVDHSFVSVVPTTEGPTRYRLLKVLRRFALDRLETSAEANDTRRRFVHYFVSLAEAATANLTGTESPRWLATLDAELDNVRAVFAMPEATVELKLQLATAMVAYWHYRGLIDEGRVRLRELVAVMDGASPSAVGALNGLSWLSWAQGDMPMAARRARGAFRCARRGVDSAGAAYALLRLAQAQYDSGRPETAGKTATRAAGIADEVGDARLTAECLLQIGQTALVTGRLGEAERVLNECVRLLSLTDRLDRLAMALLVLGRVHLGQGRTDEAEPALVRSLKIARQFALVRYSVPILESMATLAAARRDYQRAAKLVGAAAGLLERMGVRPPSSAPMRAGMVARWEPALRSPGGERAHAEGRAMDLAQAVAFALRESDPATGPKPAPPRTREVLTPRQLEVARLVARHMSNREIATRLGVSERTAEGHLEQIFNRLGFNSRTQLVEWVVRHDAVE